MTKYAFVIDHRKCIGCHACTVACKAEHDVPIGVYRTWVKYIEKGQFPNSRRYFLVNRCNHCTDAPCVAICPTKALFKRDDGIVDFDSSRCIGCKSCMQACPYDALYIDPYSHTAAKCNYCAHRTELGLEPACVVVCPERAIIAGDMHNPNTEIAQIIAREQVRVRKPEQGTGPNVYYLGVEEETLNPQMAVEELPHMSMWSTMLKPQHEDESEIDNSKSLRTLKTMNALNPFEPSEPLQHTRADSHIVYDTPKNRMPWGWKVSAYLVTKALGAGVMVVAALALALYALQGTLSSTLNGLLGIGAPVIGGLFIGGLLSFTDILRWLLLPVVLLGVAAAGYSAFLFGQAEGRDFWQSPLMLPILVVQALLAGAAGLGLLGWALNAGRAMSNFLTVVLLSALVLHVLLVFVEVFGAHRNSHVATAARHMSRGGLKDTFWGPFFTVGSLVPIVMLVVALFASVAQPGLLGMAGIFALAGLYAYEHCFVVAGQIVPLS